MVESQDIHTEDRNLIMLLLINELPLALTSVAHGPIIKSEKPGGERDAREKRKGEDTRFHFWGSKAGKRWQRDPSQCELTVLMTRERERETVERDR